MAADIVISYVARHVVSVRADAWLGAAAMPAVVGVMMMVVVAKMRVVAISRRHLADISAVSRQEMHPCVTSFEIIGS